ncbi:MAG: hypothetical protein RQ982_06275, partial [Gammaproteobacteria bacterium]|nr:hypothetical protein [Gammaproteobacteria bacterium]
MKESTVNKVGINAMLASLAEDIVNLMLREHQNIHQELEHVGQLINEASASLATSFDALNKIAEKQCSMLSLRSQKNHDKELDISAMHNKLEQQFKKNQL